jgi:chain length determinant protein EpsF
MDKDPDVRQDWQADGGKGTLEQYIAEVLGKGLDVKPSHESDVISVQYTSSDPQFAAQVVNAFAKAYVEVSLELRTDPARASSTFFDERTKQLRADVEAAQARLSDFQGSHGISVTDERIDIENARLTDLGTQLTAVQALHAESQSRQAQANNSAANSPDVLQNPVVQQLRTDISRSEAKLNELRKQYGANHPQFQSAQAELDALNSKLQSEMRQVAGSMGTANVVNVQREQELQAALDAQRKRVLAMRAERDQAVVLEKDLEAAQKAYELVTQRRSQTNLESLNQQANVAVLSESLPPLVPSRPRVRLNLLVGLFFGTLLGVGLALALELKDRRIRGQEDAAHVFGKPLLVVLPSKQMRGHATWREPFLLTTKMKRLRFRRKVQQAG